MEKGWGDTNNILEFICADIKTKKERVDHFDTPLAKYQETSESHAKWLSHLESFYGWEEKDREDIRTEVIQTDQAVLPEAKDELRCGYSALPRPKKDEPGCSRALSYFLAVVFILKNTFNGKILISECGRVGHYFLLVLDIANCCKCLWLQFLTWK